MYDDHDRNNNVMCKVLKGKKKFIVEIVDSDFFRSWWMSPIIVYKTYQNLWTYQTTSGSGFLSTWMLNDDDVDNMNGYLPPPPVLHDITPTTHSYWSKND